MAERPSTHPNWIAAGIVVVAGGMAMTIPVIVTSFRGLDYRYEVAGQLGLALGYLVSAGGYWAWVSAAGRLGDRSVVMARPLSIFAVANVLFAAAYLAYSWMSLSQEVGHPFAGWSRVVWSTSQVVTCIGFVLASVALWVSSRAVSNVVAAVEEPVPADILG